MINNPESENENSAPAEDARGSLGRLLVVVAAAAVLLVAGVGLFSVLGGDEPAPLGTADDASQPSNSSDESGTEESGQADTEDAVVGASDSSPLGFWLAVDLDRGADDPIPTDRGFGPLLSLLREEVQDPVTLVESEENLVDTTDVCSTQFGTFDWDSSGVFDARAFETILDSCDEDDEFNRAFAEGVAAATAWTITDEGTLVLSGPDLRFEFVESNEFGDNVAAGEVPAERAQLNFFRFETPDGNIQCGWDERLETLTCRILDQTWEIRDADIPEGGTCPADFGSEIELSIGGQPQFTCVSEVPAYFLDANGQPATFEPLADGDEFGFGSIRCSSPDGQSLTCFDQETGATFTMDRDVYPFGPVLSDLQRGTVSLVPEVEDVQGTATGIVPNHLVDIIVPDGWEVFATPASLAVVSFDSGSSVEVSRTVVDSFTPDSMGGELSLTESFTVSFDDGTTVTGTEWLFLAIGETDSAKIVRAIPFPDGTTLVAEVYVDGDEPIETESIPLSVFYQIGIYN